MTARLAMKRALLYTSGGWLAMLTAQHSEVM